MTSSVRTDPSCSCRK